MTVQFLDIEQGSTEWLTLRKRHVTSTDASVVTGLNPWMTPYKLWCQKMDLEPPIEENEAMREGRRLEPLARHWINHEGDYDYKPAVVINGINMSSLDGIMESSVLEIKCGRKSYEDAEMNIIAPYYIAQIQHQLYVTRKDLCLYLAFNGKQGIVIPVQRDPDFINAMIPKCKEFYDCIMDYNPPEMTERDIPTCYHPDWKNYSQRYSRNAKLLKLLEVDQDYLKEKLIECSGNSSTQGDGIRLIKSKRKGAIQYGNIPELKEVDLESYRKPAIEMWRVTLNA